jgi:hypothetical protein
VRNDIFDPNFDHFPIIFEIDSYYQRQKTEIYKRKESPASWKKFHLIMKDIDIRGQMPSHEDGLTNQELMNAILAYIVQILINAYEKATPLVKLKPPPIGGFLTRTTIRHLAHARRLYRSMIRRPEDESKPYIRAKLKLINKANRWRIRKDREAWEIRRLHTSKERGSDFYRYMNEVTRTTSTIGPILTPEGKLRSSDKGMASAFNDYLCNLMKPSTKHNIDWNKMYEPKERQLLVAAIPGSTDRNPMENATTKRIHYRTSPRTQKPRL